jgi:hypothetical protein
MTEANWSEGPIGSVGPRRSEQDWKFKKWTRYAQCKTCNPILQQIHQYQVRKKDAECNGWWIIALTLARRTMGGNAIEMKTATDVLSWQKTWKDSIFVLTQSYFIWLFFLLSWSWYKWNTSTPKCMNSSSDRRATRENINGEHYV